MLIMEISDRYKVLSTTNRLHNSSINPLHKTNVLPTHLTHPINNDNKTTPLLITNIHLSSTVIQTANKVLHNLLRKISVHPTDNHHLNTHSIKDPTLILQHNHM
jgi:hypothetical protein